jgi:DNA-directed RNA polymerase beta' subunit
MNFHIPQSAEATVELEEIAAVPHHIITPRHAKPMIGIYQDTLVGSYRLTQPGIEFTRREFMNLMMWNKRFDGIMPTPRGPLVDKPRWTGQQVLGALMPPINMEMGNKSYDSEKETSASHNYVKIVQGDITQGVVDGDIYMKPSKGIIHIAYNDCGPKDTVALLDALQNTVENFLVLNGFSVGISDLIADEDTKKLIDTKIQEKKKQVEQVILQVHLDLFENNTGKTNQQEFEDQIFGILNQATSDAGSTGQQSLSAENRLLAMVRSGSKGEPLNVAQMMACLGQTAIEGKRVPYGFTDRTLPHYKKYDDSSEARGFIESSFIRGLTPQQFFFHAMSGREGLIDTAVKTADTGYIQRQLIKSMEDLTVQHDGTVRDTNNNIIQYHYGEDGVNPTKIETQSLPIGKLSEQEIRSQFGMDTVDWTTVLQEEIVRENEEEMITEYVNQILQDQRMMVEGVFQKKSLDSGSVFAPVNLARWILNIKVRFALKSEKTDLTPAMVLQGIQKIIERTHSYHKIWAALLRFHLAPHKLIVKERFTKVAFETLVDIIVVNHMKAWVQPGEQVGIVAAQSIGEPATQMSEIGSTIICVSDGKAMRYYGSIREFIDPILEKNKEKVQTIASQSVVLPMEDDYYIVGVSEDEKTSWKRISEISRHPANGGIIEVITRTGRKTTATLSHSFLKRSPTGIVPVLGSELEIGMRIPIAKVIPEVPNPLTQVTQGSITFTMNREFGWVCGMYLADGCFKSNTVSISKISPVVEPRLRAFGEQYNIPFTTRDHPGAFGPGKDNNLYSKDLKDFLMDTFGTGSYEKKIGATVFHANKEFIAGVIGGFFDGDGNISVERQLIRASSRSETLIQQITALLGYVGMFGCMSQETSVRIKDKVQYTLTIPRKFAATYKEQVGFQLPEKAEALDKIIEYNAREDVRSEQEMIDKIPEVGAIIAETGKLLKMPGQSRTYGRWAKKESIGRQTLTKYVAEFEAKCQELDAHAEGRAKIEANMDLLRSALAADVFWDEIVELNEYVDPKEFVYDFTVPGNDSFMVDCNVLVHNTLNTFHQAGVASKSAVTRGVPRLRELLKVTQNPKASSLTIYLKPEYRNNKEKAREVVQDLELTVLRTITNKVAIYWDEKDETTVVEEDKELMRFFALFEQDEQAQADPLSKWVLRLELNREEMFNRNLSIQEVVSVIKMQFNFEIDIVYSDYNSDKLVMRIRLPNKDKKDKDTASQQDDFTNLKKFQNKLLNSIVIRGLPGIKAVTFRKDSQYVESIDGQYTPVEQFVLDTDGSNFIKVMNHPAVDGTKLYSTNVWDVYEVLGIEATRAILFNEINGLFESVGVNFRHLCLLCDVMTRFGKLMSIDRYGINKNDIGTLAKASFEETEKILLKAALFGEVDPVMGVSANIMMGQPIRGGTAFSQILLDDQVLAQLLKDIDVDKHAHLLEEEKVGDLSQLEETTELTDPCGAAPFQMNMVMPNAIPIMEEPDVEMNILM